MTVIAYTGPTVSPEVPWEVRRHLQLFYDKLANHTQAFSLLNQKIASVQTGTSTTVVEGGGGSSTPVTSTSVLTVNNQSGVTSYSTVSGDNGALIVFSDASPIAVTLAVQTPPWGCFIANQGTGTATLTPAANGASTPTISYAGHSGAANLPLLGGYCCVIAFDGANWWAWTEPIVPVTIGASAHLWLNSYDDTTGMFTATQPAFSDISGVASASQLPTPTATTIGGVEAAGPTAHQWINEIDTSGVPHLSQPAMSDISGSPLSGTSASLGGSAMTVGQRITAAVTITGAAVGMVAMCNPETDPGAGFVWNAFVSGANTVTVCLTCVAAGTPVAGIYSVRILQ